MATRIIKKEGDPVLRKKSRVVTNFDERLSQLIDDMKETMYKSDGVGLAAVQVGILKRVVVVDCTEDRSGFHELVNPVIIDHSGEQVEQEGCLSLPGVGGKTMRPLKVKVRAQNRFGETLEYEGEGLLARCYCHEIDHLDGVLFSDRLAEGEKLFEVD